MNENPEIASAWMGRMLMHIECVDEKQPVRKMEKCEGVIKQTAIDQGLIEAKNEYEFIAEVGLGICLPEYTDSFTVKIQIGEFSVETKGPK